MKRGPTIIRSLTDRVLASGYEGAVWLFAPKRSVIATARGNTLREMRRRKYIIFEALKDAWRIGQTREDHYGQWKCIGATKGHVLIRRKGAAVHVITEREWDELDPKAREEG